jgi:hypothetical protein
MSSLIDLATATTRSWTNLYTWRLPDELRNGRRNEIESDLWEHHQLARMIDEPSHETGLEMLTRFVMGVPADLSWRIETGAIVRSEKRSTAMTTESRRMQFFGWVAYFVIAMIPITGVAATIRGFQNDVDLGWMAFGIIPVLASVPILIGLAISRDRQPLGILLVAGGCLVVTVTWFWMFMITIPISAGLIALSYYRAKKAGWRAGSPPDLAT